MANINKIRISGTSYDIQDLNAPSVSAVTQQEYDNLPSSAKTSNTFFVITDAQAGDLTQYWTSAQTESAITQATSGKVDTSSVVTAVTSGSTDSEIPTAKAVWDVASQGGGGTTYSAGRGISITTGETADTINCTIPIAVGSSNSSVSIGENNGLGTSVNSAAIGKNNGIANFSRASLVVGENNSVEFNLSCAFAFGYGSSAKTSYSFANGLYTITKNTGELSTGKYNVSNTGSTNADNTLFSVGNGTADNARHNAFEIRKNGDIYCNNGTNDVKLQDYLQIKVVKLTQQEYDAITTKDNNTLYVIT